MTGRSGRSGRSGQDHPRAVLADVSADAMRDAYEAGGWTMRELADAWGVTKSTVHRVVAGERKRATPRPEP